MTIHSVLPLPTMFDLLVYKTNTEIQPYIFFLEDLFYRTYYIISRVRCVGLMRVSKENIAYR